MGPLIAYLETGQLPIKQEAARLVRRDAAKYTIVADRLYKRGLTHPLLRCLTHTQAEYVMHEVHEGICRSHIGGRALAAKII